MPPNRTRNTALSDDELLVFDAMFDGYQFAGSLVSCVYPWHLNVPYTHGLDDAQLLEFLERSAAQGLLWRKSLDGDCQKNCLYVLSNVGGSLWESERLPDWSTFLVASQRQLPKPDESVQRIVTSSKTIARICAGAFFGAGLVVPAGPIRTRAAFQRRLVPWKVFDRVAVVRFPTKFRVYRGQCPVDWTVYEASRCWWQTLSELKMSSGIQCHMMAYQSPRT